MDDKTLRLPKGLTRIYVDTARLGFKMACEEQTGSLLRTLAATKRGGALLEIGTGTGVGTAWILDGMDKQSTLITVEQDATVNAVAQRYLCDDKRITFVTEDAEVFLKESHPKRFDFIFADTFPGKFYLLNEALAMLKPGGLYIIDDLLPQPTWPAEHQASVDRLVQELEGRNDLIIVQMNWASGLIIATKR